MSRSLIAMLMVLSTLSLAACESADPEEKAKVVVAPVVLKAPAGNDDKEWKIYLQQVVGQHMDGVTDRVFPYYLPGGVQGSTVAVSGPTLDATAPTVDTGGTEIPADAGTDAEGGAVAEPGVAVADVANDASGAYDRQLENVSTVMARTVLPGNMLVFGSPDSAAMANLVVSALGQGRADALRGSQVLFIGKPADSSRVQAAVEKVGGKFIFVEAN